MPIGLFALAIGGFGIGLTEFIIAGLLPEVAADFAVSIPVAGYLISGYALSVVVGGLVLTAVANRFGRKKVLMALLGLFIAGNALSALAPTFGLMMAGRVVAALCHGAFFGIGAVVAADLVAPGRRAAAIATMFAGLTTANVLGVPLGTILGQQYGWRSTFWAITAIGIVALVGIATLVPAAAGAGIAGGGLASELRAFRRPQVLLSLLITVLGFGGMFGTFTYIAPLLTEVAGFAPSSVGALLVLFGIGMFVGNLAGGRLADRALTASVLTLLAVLVVILLVMTLFSSVAFVVAAALLLMGGIGFATVPGLQMRVMQYAKDAPTMASGANIAAFNLGNAFGAYLGGLTITAGFGYRSPAGVGTALAAAGLLVMIVATLLARKADADRTTTAAPARRPVESPVH